MKLFLAILIILFSFGSCFNVSEIESTADNVYNWIQSVSKDGSFTLNNTIMNQYDLYSGSCGVIIFLLEYYQFKETKPSFVLDFAEQIADDILKNYKDFKSKFDESFFHGGLGGLGFCVYEINQYVQKSEYVDFYDSINNEIVSDYQKNDPKYNCLRWGSAGTGLYLLWLMRLMEETTYISKSGPTKDDIVTSIKAGTELLMKNAVQVDSDKIKWFYYGNDGLELPNYADGTAGIAYYLAELYQTFGDIQYLNSSLQGANYLVSIANLSNDGCLIFHGKGFPDNAKYYLTECNGNTGTAKFWAHLYYVTQDEQWKEMAIRSGKNLLDYYPSTNWWIPKEGVQDYYWNTNSLCDGTVGVIETFYILNQLNPNPEYDTAIEFLVDHIMAKRDFVEEDKVCWIQAQDRVRPDEKFKQVGFYQGAGGITQTLMHLVNDAIRIKLPDYLF